MWIDLTFPCVRGTFYFQMSFFFYLYLLYSPPPKGTVVWLLSLLLSFSLFSLFLFSTMDVERKVHLRFKEFVPFPIVLCPWTTKARLDHFLFIPIVTWHLTIHIRNTNIATCENTNTVAVLWKITATPTCISNTIFRGWIIELCNWETAQVLLDTARPWMKLSVESYACCHASDRENHYQREY